MRYSGVQLPRLLGNSWDATTASDTGRQVRTADKYFGLDTLPISQTGAMRVESLGEVVATVADPAEALRSLAAVGSDPVDAVKAVAKVGSSSPFEALSGVVQNTGVRFIATVKSLLHLAGSPGFVVSMPACRVGDIVFAHFGINAISTNFDLTLTMTGWTQLAFQRIDLSYELVYYRIIDGSESWFGTQNATELVMMGGSTPELNQATTQATSYRNVDPTNPVSAIVQGGSTAPSASSFTTSPLTLPEGSDLLLMFTSILTAGVTLTPTLPSGMTTRYNNAAPSGVMSLSLIERLFPPGAYTFSASFSSSGEWGGTMVALRPAVSGAASTGSLQIDTIQKIAKTKDTVYTKNVLKNAPYVYYQLEDDGTSIYYVGKDSSGNGHDGQYKASGVTYHAAALVSDGYAVVLDGNSYLNLSSLVVPAGNQIVLEAWIKTNVGSGAIWSARDHNQNRCFAFDLNGSGKIEVLFWDSGGVNHGFTVGATNVADGLPHHVVATYDGTTQRVYVDGNLDGSTVVSFTLRSGVIGDCQVGAFLDLGVFAGGLIGTVDEAAIYFSVNAVTPAKIKERFLSAQQNGLVAIETLAPIRKVGPFDPLESGAGITSTKAMQLDAKKTLVATVAEPFEALAPTSHAVSNNAGLPIETLKPISAATVLRAESLVKLTKTLLAPLEGLKKLTATVAAPLEARLALSKTGSDPVESLVSVRETTVAPAEALHPVSRSASEAVEALRQVAQTAVAPLEAPTPVAAVSSTALAPVETLQGLRKSAVDPAEALQALRRLAVEAVEALVGLRVSRTTSAEALRNVARASQAVAEALVGVRATSGLPVSAEGGVTRRASMPVEALRELQVARTMIAEAGIRVTRTVAVPAETLERIAKLATEPYEAVGGVVVGRASTVEALRPVAAQIGVPFEAAVGVVAVAGLPFEALQKIIVIVVLPGEDPPVQSQAEGDALPAALWEGRAVAVVLVEGGAKPVVIVEGSAEAKPT